MPAIKLVKLKGSPPRYRLSGGDAAQCQIANQFLYSLEVRALSSHSVRAYGFDLALFLRWIFLTKLSFAALTQADLLRFIEHQKENGASPASINRRLTTCEQYYRFVHQRPLPRGIGVTLPKSHYRGEGYERNLGLNWQKRTRELRLRVKMPQQIVEPLTRDEVITFLRSLRCYRDLAMTLAMGLCGLRSCEVISLQLSGVDLKCSRMRVFGKGRKERIVPMAAQLVDAVNKYLLYERPEFSPSSNLFVCLQGHRVGETLTAAGFISLFHRKRLKISLQKANPHRFRHTFGADMARAGMQLPTLKKLMGHACEKMTLRYILLNNEDITEEFYKTMARIGKKYEDQTRRPT